MEYIVNHAIIWIEKEFTILYHRKYKRYYKLSYQMELMLKKFLNPWDIQKCTKLEKTMAKQLISQEIIVPSFLGEKSICKMRKQKEHNPLDTIQIEITKKCNFICKHCYLRSRNTQSSCDLKKEQLFKIIDEASLMGVFEFDITGGEPLIRDDFEEILMYIYNKGMRIRVFTNGYLLNNRLINFFKQINVYRVRISVDGKDKDTHDKIRGIKSFEVIQNNINKLLNSGIEVEVSTTLMRDNLTDIHDLLETYKNREGLYHITDAYISNKKVDSLKITEQEYVNAIQERFKGWDFHSRAIKKKFHCNIARNFLFIDYSGIGKLCPTFPAEYNLGNVLEFGIQPIWDNAIKQYSDRLSCSKKDSCKYSELCDGGCRSRALFNGGSVDSEDSYMCALMSHIVN